MPWTALPALPDGELKREDAGWAVERLLGSEQGLWTLMSDSDRRHAISVARRVSSALGSHADRPVLAALLQNVGQWRTASAYSRTSWSPEESGIGAAWVRSLQRPSPGAQTYDLHSRTVGQERSYT